MKAFLIILLTVPLCMAQRRSAPAGFGNVAHPGAPATFGGRIGSGNIRNASRVYAYPGYVGGVYYGGYYGGFSNYADPSSYGYGYAPQTQPPVNVTVVNAPPQVPTVIINQNYGPPQQPMMEQQQTAAPAETSEAPAPPHYFLVAFKDHSVYSALTFWIEDKTLHYVTPQQTHNQASLDLVDMDFTNKLNQR